MPSLFFPPLLVLLQAAPGPTGSIDAGGAIRFFGAILAFFKAVGVSAFSVSGAYSGYELMFSRSPRAQDNAKEGLKWALVGLALVLGADTLGALVDQAARVGSGG